MDDERSGLFLEILGGHLEELLLQVNSGRPDGGRFGGDSLTFAKTVVSGIRETQPARCADITIGAGLIAVADKGLMTAVLENLIGNAWKFTAKTEKACIAFGAVKRDQQAVFFVKDNGVGFDPEHAKDMFRPFHRLHSEGEFDGTGIGLSIVERIIARHGGDVWAEGCIGKGATVFFTLPTPPC